MRVIFDSNAAGSRSAISSPMFEQGIKSIRGKTILISDRVIDRPDRDHLAARFELYRFYRCEKPEPAFDAAARSVGFRSRLDINAHFDRSELLDPVTGDERAFDGSNLRDVQADFRHNIAATQWAWGATLRNI